jgi:hypothetical protein
MITLPNKGYLVGLSVPTQIALGDYRYPQTVR